MASRKVSLPAREDLERRVVGQDPLLVDHEAEARRDAACADELEVVGAGRSG